MEAARQVHVGDAVRRPCMAGLHWLRFEVQRIEQRGVDVAGWSEIAHTCRGVDLRESRLFRVEDLAIDFAPDLALPAPMRCWRCALPIYPGLNVGRGLYLDCCQKTSWTCSHCVDLPWTVGEFTSWEAWLLGYHAPRCGRRCGDCRAIITPELAWQCTGCGLAQQRACEPRRCAPCFAKHRTTCDVRVFRPANYRCPECDHSAIEVVEAASGAIRRCTWCKAEWQAEYRPGAPEGWARPIGAVPEAAR